MLYAVPTADTNYWITEMRAGFPRSAGRFILPNYPATDRTEPTSGAHKHLYAPCTRSDSLWHAGEPKFVSYATYRLIIPHGYCWTIRSWTATAF